MQELIPKLWDDLDWHQDGKRTPADETMTVGLAGVWVELDLSSSHAKDLRETLEICLAAGRSVEAPQQRKPGRHSPGIREYNRGMREWAQANGWTIKTEATGKYYYSKSLKAAYAAHLEAQR